MRLMLRLLWVASFVGVLVFGWWFAAANAVPVTISYVYGQLSAVPLWLALVVAFASGAAAVAVLGVYPALKSGLSRRRYRKLIRGLESELHQLRNLPLANDDATPPGGGERLASVPRSAHGRGG